MPHPQCVNINTQISRKSLELLDDGLETVAMLFDLFLHVFMPCALCLELNFVRPDRHVCRVQLQHAKQSNTAY